MAVKEILTVPNTKLNTKCQDVLEFGAETKELAKNIVDTLLEAKNPEGAGLAAPQLGVLKRMCVVRKFTEDKETGELINSTEYVLANPAIVKQSSKKVESWEACLSIPDVYARVERAQKIKVEAFDESGEKFRLNASGFFARVIQHEIDHLDGILITDKAIGETMTEEQFQKILEQYDQKL